MRERKESGYARDISQECEGRECKRKLKCKWIDNTQQPFRTMQEVVGGYEDENGDERLGEIESFYSVFALEDMPVPQKQGPELAEIINYLGTG